MTKSIDTLSSHNVVHLSSVGSTSNMLRLKYKTRKLYQRRKLQLQKDHEAARLSQPDPEYSREPTSSFEKQQRIQQLRTCKKLRKQKKAEQKNLLKKPTAAENPSQGIFRWFSWWRGTS